MQYIEQWYNVVYLPVASNDNEDLLSFATPAADLALIRALKHDMRTENSATGILLQSRKQRRFFQEIMDAERYIVLRYFTLGVSEDTIRQLKRYILDHYLFPKLRRRRAKPKPT